MERPGIDPDRIPEGKLNAAGGVVATVWEDPRRAARAGRAHTRALLARRSGPPGRARLLPLSLAPASRRRRQCTHVHFCLQGAPASKAARVARLGLCPCGSCLQEPADQEMDEQIM